MARERNSKKTTTPPRTGQRTTARGFSVARDDDEPAVEPPHSARPTQRDLAPIVESVPDARGQYSVQSARRIQTDVVSGTIDVSETSKRRRGASSSGADVRLVTANERELSVVIRGDQITLRRNDARALARLIDDAFGR